MSRHGRGVHAYVLMIHHIHLLIASRAERSLAEFCRLSDIACDLSLRFLDLYDASG